MPTVVYRFTDPHGKRREVASAQLGAGAAAAAESSIVNLRVGERLGKGSYGSVYHATIVPPVSISYSRAELGLVVKLGSIRGFHTWLACKRGASFFKVLYPEAAARGHVVCKSLPDSSYVTIMPKLPGYTLNRWLTAKNVPREAKLSMLFKVLRALKEQLHDKGIYHGDLNPLNILVTKSSPDRGHTISFIDFDYAYRAEGEVTGDYVRPEERHYFHPGRQDGDKAKLLTPHPSQDIYSLVCYLDRYMSEFDAGFLYDLYHGEKMNTVTVAEVLAAIEGEYFIEKICPVIQNNAGFIDVAKMGFGAVLLWLKENVTELRSQSEEAIEKLTKIAAKRLLLAWFVESVGSQSVEGLRSFLPEHLSWVTDESLLAVIRYGQQRQLVSEIYARNAEIFIQEFYFGSDDTFCSWLEQQHPDLADVRVIDVKGCWRSANRQRVADFRRKVLKTCLDSGFLCAFADKEEVQSLAARGMLVTSDEGVRLLRRALAGRFEVVSDSLLRVVLNEMVDKIAAVSKVEAASQGTVGSKRKRECVPVASLFGSAGMSSLVSGEPKRDGGAAARRATLP